MKHAFRRRCPANVADDVEHGVLGYRCLTLGKCQATQALQELNEVSICNKHIAFAAQHYDAVPGQKLFEFCQLGQRHRANIMASHLNAKRLQLRPV